MDQAVTKDNYEKFLGDNLHYNIEGAKLINELVCKELKRINNEKRI